MNERNSKQIKTNVILIKNRRQSGEPSIYKKIQLF